VTYPFATLPGNLAAFCAMLRRDYGFRAGARELQDAARALEIVNLADERAVRDALRPILASRLEHARVFDAAFDRFFRAAGGPPPRQMPSGRPIESRKPGGTAPGGGQERDDDADVREPSGAETAGGGAVSGVPGTNGEARPALLRATSSPLEAEGAMPVLGPADRAWREAASLLLSRMRAGLSRRWRPARRGQRFDLRRTLRTSLHTGGDVVMPRWRARPRRRPRVGMLIDGSRSMTPYVAPVLDMAVALASSTLDAETFTFSTALRRVTREVRRAAAGERRRLHLHHAWGGGTTIGACLREFVRHHGDRLLGRETFVIIASDGLEVGDPRVLGAAMGQLSRRSAAIVWLNPLLATSGYEPTALGMSAARPYVTTFASVANPADLARLARTLRI